MSAGLFIPPSRALDANGNPYSGAIWRFYDSGTTTPRAVYANSALTVSLGSAVTADSGGKFANIYLDADHVYRAVLKNASGSVTLHDIDPWITGSGGGGGGGDEGDFFDDGAWHENDDIIDHDDGAWQP